MTPPVSVCFFFLEFGGYKMPKMPEQRGPENTEPSCAQRASVATLSCGEVSTLCALFCIKVPGIALFSWCRYPVSAHQRA